MPNRRAIQPSGKATKRAKENIAELDEHRFAYLIANMPGIYIEGLALPAGRVFTGWLEVE